MKRLLSITHSLVRNEGLFLLPILIGCSLSVFLLVTVRFFPVDDAYIFRKYVENLANEYGFAYNPGEISFGASSFLFVIVLALLQKLTGGWDYTLTAGLLGVALFGGSIYVAGKMIWRETQNKLTTLAGAFGLAIAPPLFCTAVSGMETILYVFLLLCLFGVVIRWGITRPWLLGVMAALLYLTRPDGVIALALIWFLALPLAAADRSSRWTMRDHRLSLLQTMIPFALLAIPYHIYIWVRTGYLFPTTFYGKMIDMVPGWLAMNLDTRLYLTFQAIGVALEGFFSWNPLAHLMLLLFFGYNALETYHLIRSRVWALGISLGKITRITFFFALPLAYSFLVFPGKNGFGGYYQRYILPVYPLFIMGATLGVHQATSLAKHLFSSVPNAQSDFTPDKLVKRVFRVGVVICPWTIYLLALLLLIKGIPTHVNIYQGLSLEKNRLRYNVGLWLRDNTPQDARVAIGAPGLGVVGYYADRYILDLGALIDPDIFPYYQAVAQGANKMDKILEYMRDKRATHLVHDSNLRDYPYLDLLTVIDTPAEAKKWGLKEQGVYLFQR